MMTLQKNADPRGRRTIKFTPENIQKIKDWVAEGISREEIAKLVGVTLGSLQVTCSRLGISLRRRHMSNGSRLGTPRTVRRPYLPSRSPIAGQRHAGAFQITLEHNGTRRTAELPLTSSAMGRLKLEAEMRKLSMGQLLAEVATMAIRKGMIKEILREPSPDPAPQAVPESP
jgi:hypothetical protein